VTRERRVVEIFVELADTLVEDFDVVDLMHRLGLRCVELLDCAEAGLLLANPSGSLQVMASSSERPDALEVLGCDDGPCIECYSLARAVGSEDLSADLGRWPTFAAMAISKGFHSASAVPMRVHGETIGALIVLRTGTGHLDAEDARLAQGLADIASIALLQERALRQSHQLVTQLEGALTSRVIIEQAKGILAEQAGVGLDGAFSRLRAHARSNNLRLVDVARRLIDGELTAATLAETPVT
jgi:GAF domain-containing protein